MTSQTDRIKLVDLRRQYAPLREEILAAIDGIFTEMELFLGPNVRTFEHDFAEYIGVQHGIGVDNGTDALLLAMQAFGIGRGDEVITPANTFVAVIEAILAVGATPVMVDINPDTYNIDVEAMRAAITSRTRAVVPAHLYGTAADMDPILESARSHGILVIEDASQAQGAKYKGKRVGSMGDASAFSLYYTKNLGGYGESGIVTTNDGTFADKISMLRQHGASSGNRYLSQLVGYNSRLDEIQAAILRIKLRHLDRWNDQRRHWASLYTELLGDSVVTPKELPGFEPVYYAYVIRTPARDEVKATLWEHGIESGIHYPVPLNLQPICQPFGFRSGQFPISERYAGEILSLPMFPELTEGEVERISAAVRSAVSEGARTR